MKREKWKVIGKLQLEEIKTNSVKKLPLVMIERGTSLLYSDTYLNGLY